MSKRRVNALNAYTGVSHKDRLQATKQSLFDPLQVLARFVECRVALFQRFTQVFHVRLPGIDPYVAKAWQSDGLAIGVALPNGECGDSAAGRARSECRAYRYIAR